MLVSQVGSWEGGGASGIVAENCRQAWKNMLFLQLMHAEWPAVVWQ